MNVETAPENGEHGLHWILLRENYQSHHDRTQDLDVALEGDIRILRPDDARRHKEQQGGEPGIESQGHAPVEAAPGENPKSDERERKKEVSLDAAAVGGIAAVAGQRDAPEVEPKSDGARRHDQVPEGGPKERARSGETLFRIHAKREEDEDDADQERKGRRH